MEGFEGDAQRLAQSVLSDCCGSDGGMQLWWWTSSRGRTLSGHFQRHAYRHQAISQQTLENIDVRERVHGRRSKRIIRQFLSGWPKSSRMASSLRLIDGGAAEPSHMSLL